MSAPSTPERGARMAMRIREVAGRLREVLAKRMAVEEMVVNAVPRVRL